jgi:pimeloyl-ACP methyl ester carboxylesterase
VAAVVWSETTVHGHAVSYGEAGRPAGDDPPRPVVLLVHGIASRAQQWERVMAELGEQAHVVAPDLLGHGSSAKPRGDYSLGAHANGLRDLLDALGHERVTVVGHSLGGGIAMQFAYQFPQRVARLALVGAGGLGKEVTPLLRMATLPGAELVLPVLTASWLRRGATSLGGLLTRARVPLPEVVQEAVAGFDAMGDPGARAAFVHTARSVVDPLGQRVDARNRLHLTAHLPLLVVWGRRDGVIPLSHGTALAEAVEGARLEVFEQSGHFPHVTEPHRLARLLAEWLDDTPAAPETTDGSE